MTRSILSQVHPTRLSSYVDECARVAGVAPSDVPEAAVSSLYTWQVSLNAAWFEVLAYVEAVIRNSMDSALRRWNERQGQSQDWLDDAAAPLRGLVSKAKDETRRNATKAATYRAPAHPRHGARVDFDDRVAQLSFGNLVFLLPHDPPQKRTQHGTGRNGRENLWVHGLHEAFPHLDTELLAHHFKGDIPDETLGGYAVGHALERLRRLRNRIGHHEQTFQVEHTRRLSDVSALLQGIDGDLATDIDNLETVRRTLALRPSF